MSGSKFDDLLTKIGSGKWNLMYFVAVGYWNMHLASNTLSGPYVAPALSHTCLPPNQSYVITSKATNDSKDFCHYTSTNDPSIKEECTAWEFDNSTFTYTLTSQFNLVCSSEYLRATYQSIYMLGTFFGAPINGLTSDRFGRKSTLSLAVLMYFSLALSSCWLTSLPAILASRFILGFIHPAVLQTGYILAMEVCELKYRSVAGIVMSLPWAFGTMAWGGVAYLIRDWRWLQLTVNLPALLIFPILWFLDESPRWLIVHGKFKQVSLALEKASRWNNTTLPPQEELQTLMQTIRTESTKTKLVSLDKQNEAARTYRQKTIKFLWQLLIIFRHPKLRTIICILSLKFFLVSMIFYGLSLNAVNYSADPFLYMVLSGLVEVPAYTIPVPIVARLGRKWPSIVLYFVSGVVIIAVAVTPSDQKVSVMVLVLIGRMCISAAFQILYLYCMELLPTQVRLQGLGYCTIFSRIGSMVSPFITEVLGPLYPAGPSLVFGLGALVAGVATIPLHETLGKKLPDTIADLDNEGEELIRLEECGEEGVEEVVEETPAVVEEKEKEEDGSELARLNA